VAERTRVRATATSWPAEIGTGPIRATIRAVERTGKNTEKYTANPTATAAFDPVWMTQ